MKQKKIVPTILSVVFLAVGWQLISFEIGYPALFPSFFELLRQVFLQFSQFEFYVSVLFTILRGAVGFGIAYGFAFLFASVAAFSSFWKSFFHPLLVVLRSIPVISFVLLAILWFSPPNMPIFIAIITMLPILYQNILTGFEQTDIRWVEMASLYGKSRYERFKSIYLPASRSAIFDGISTAMGFGWRAIIIGEVMAQPLHGIGTAMKQAQAFINVSELMAWTLIAILVSYLFELLIRRIRRHKEHHHFHPIYSSSGFSKSECTAQQIDVSQLSKTINGKTILNDYSIAFSSREVNCIKGASGIGKTTLLRLLAGLEEADRGNIRYSGKQGCSYSFQDVRLLPWLTIAENIAYVLPSAVSSVEKNSVITYLLTKLELIEQADAYPGELSGGQKQRAGLARALAARSEILLLDEPLTGLDDALKIKIIQFLSEWIAANKPIVIWATHEQIQLDSIPVRVITLGNQ